MTTTTAVAFIVGALFLPSLLVVLLLLRTLVRATTGAHRIIAAAIPNRPRNRALAGAIAYSADRLRFLSAGGVTLILAVGSDDRERRDALDALLDVQFTGKQPERRSLREVLHGRKEES